MDSSLILLAGTAASVGLIHTVLGPDHYVPFVAMSRIGGWTARKTLLITILCGVAHVLSSVVLGFIGIGLGALVFVNALEETRGRWAGWLLLSFGVAYTVWGIRRAIRNQPHEHLHVHDDGTVHAHLHQHHGDHLHAHIVSHGAAHTHRPGPDADAAGVGSITPWILFTIFLFGPCEPLIPFVMVPAARGNWWGVGFVTAVFGLVTLVTMTTIVMIARHAAGALPLERLGRFSHAAAGVAILACGVAVKAGL